MTKMNDISWDNINDTIKYFKYSSITGFLESTKNVTINDYNVSTDGIGYYPIYDESDLTFPLASGIYVIKNDIEITSEFTTQVGSIIYFNADGGGRTVTFSSDAIDLITANPFFTLLVFNNFNISITGNSSTLFNLSNVLLGCEKVNFLFTGGQSQTIGSVVDSPLSISFEGCIFNGWKNGLYLNNPSTRLFIEKCQFSSDQSSSGNAITVGTSGKNFECRSTTFSLSASESIFDIDSSFEGKSNIDFITNDNPETSFFSTSGLDQKSPYIEVDKSDPQERSTVSIEVFSNNMNTTTVIPSINSKVILSGSNFQYEEDNRLQVDIKGISEYYGIPPKTIKLDGNVYIEPSNSTKDLMCGFFGILPDEYEVTFDNTTNIVNEVNTLVENGDVISFYDTSATLPTTFKEELFYYVVNKTTNTFQLSYTSGGSAISFTTNGTSGNSYKKVEFSGSVPKEPIAANSPRTLVPQALMRVQKGEKIGIYLSNLTDSIDINTTDIYYRLV